MLKPTDLKSEAVLNIGHQSAGWVGLRVLGVIRRATVIQRHAPELDLQCTRQLIKMGSLASTTAHTATQLAQGHAFRQTSFMCTASTGAEQLSHRWSQLLTSTDGESCLTVQCNS